MDKFNENNMKLRLLIFVLVFSNIANAQNISGSWFGQLDVGIVKLRIVFNITKDAEGKEICTMDSPDQSAKGIPASLLYISTDSVCIKVPVCNVLYEGKLTDGELKGVFKQNGMTFNLNMKAGALLFNRPQNPMKPYPYRTEDVSFTNSKADAVLAGTISFPVGYKDGDRVPVVLMISGSGSQNRDSEIFEHKPFLVIADFLARNGIATLRYDDRAVGASTGKYQAPNTEEVAEDAQCGIEFLRKRGEFSKIGVLGHSEGAIVAFMLGSKSLIDFAVCLAAMGVPGDECLYEQYKRNIELSGYSSQMTKEQHRSLLLSRNNSWLKFFLDYNPVSDIQNTRCPVFAINGDKDVQIISYTNIPAIKSNLPNNEKSIVKVYPGLNHLFQECSTGLPSEYSSIEQTISPVVLNDIAEWINNL